MTPYSSLCDDFGVYVYLNTKMDLPSGRETVLHFFDGLRKTYPQMTDFDASEEQNDLPAAGHGPGPNPVVLPAPLDQSSDTRSFGSFFLSCRMLEHAPPLRN